MQTLILYLKMILVIPTWLMLLGKLGSEFRDFPLKEYVEYGPLYEDYLMSAVIWFIFITIIL